MYARKRAKRAQYTVRAGREGSGWQGIWCPGCQIAPGAGVAIDALLQLETQVLSSAIFKIIYGLLSCLSNRDVQMRTNGAGFDDSTLPDTLALLARLMEKLFIFSQVLVIDCHSTPLKFRVHLIQGTRTYENYPTIVTGELGKEVCDSYDEPSSTHRGHLRSVKQKFELFGIEAKFKAQIP
jgi:hypothetical protein